MQLTRPSGARDAQDVAAAVRGAAGAAGHRPAITLLAADGRQEQSFTSVAQWAAKAAHWATLELLLEPGDRLGIVGPGGWVPAVAALGAWWAGLVVAVGPAAAGAEVVVAHGDDAPGVGGEVVTWGWGFDGAPSGAGAADAFTHAVQPFPDDPPPPQGTATSPALDDGTDVVTQVALLDRLRDEPTETVGLDHQARGWLAITALRPLLTGHPTVLLGPGVTREAAAGDRVARWVA